MARLKLSRAASFWLLATLFAFFLFAAGAPSPLYVVYEAMWHFSSLTLTAIFGVYALALLAALLTTGRLSDHLGRRPVVLLALVVQIVSMVAFISARGVGMLFAARVLQGLGTGLATGALSAWLLDLQPPDNPRLGSLVASVAPVAGLATGALVSGLLVQYGPDPLHLVFSLLCAVYALALAATLVRAADARVIVIRASLVLVVGVGITELSVALGSAVGLYAGSVLAGLGFGPAFSAVFRSLAPLAPPDKRAGLLASIFIVVYLAFSVPALLAAAAVTNYGLRDTTYVYGIVVMTLAAMTAVSGSPPSGPPPPPPPPPTPPSPLTPPPRRTHP